MSIYRLIGKDLSIGSFVVFIKARISSVIDEFTAMQYYCILVGLNSEETTSLFNREQFGSLSCALIEGTTLLKNENSVKSLPWELTEATCCVSGWSCLVIYFVLVTILLLRMLFSDALSMLLTSTGGDLKSSACLKKVSETVAAVDMWF